MTACPLSALSTQMSQSIWQTNTTVLVNGVEGLTGICADTISKFVYMVQSTGIISCYAYGNNTCPRSQPGLPSPAACAVDNAYAPYGGPPKVAFSSPATGAIHTVDMNTGELVVVATDLNAPIGVKFGCVPRDSVLLPVWKIAAELFADAMVTATTDILKSLYPESEYRIYPAVTTQEEPEVDCPAMLSDYTSFTIDQGKAWAYAVTNITTQSIAAANGGSGAYTGLTAVAPVFADAINALRASKPSISAGSGAGFAMSIQCTTNNSYIPDLVLFSYGIGIGGGTGPSGCVMLRGG